MRVTKYWDVAAGVLILLGLMHLPGDMALAEALGQGGSLGWLWGAVVFVNLVPALPLALALGVLVGGRIGGGVAWGMILISALPAAILTLGAAYDSGDGEGIIWIEGAALTLACWGMLLCLAGRMRVGRLAHGMAMLVALWSLATPLAVAWSVRAVAGGSAYCIARHQPDRPIRTWAELRGVSFHTDRSGYKDTSAWFLHGVMLVDRGQGIEAWNWSPRHMRFERIGRPGDMAESPFGTCAPRAGFLDGLALL